MTLTDTTWPGSPQERLPTAERLSDLIGDIYDCALDPSKWEAVLDLICRKFSFSSGIMGIARFPGEPYVLASTGIDRDLLDRLPELSGEMAALWGGWEQIQRFPLDEPIVNSQVMPHALIRDNAYAAQWLARGVIDAAVVMISRDASILANVGFNRHGSAGPIGQGEIDGLRLLTPHFRRAVKISDLFDMKTVETATFSDMLDRFSFGIVLVEADLRIVHANTVAAGLLSAQDAIVSVRGTLTLPLRAAHEALERAVHHATSQDMRLGSRGIGILAQRRDGGACVIHVLPLRQGSLRRRFGQRTAVALFVAPATASRLPTDALTLLYDLTPAETRIFELIVAGETRAAIAKKLGIAPSTVKTHLIHLFQKTGCQRQSEMVKLAVDLSIPVLNGAETSEI